jgi:hypothetical protein
MLACEPSQLMGSPTGSTFKLSTTLILVEESMSRIG